MMREFIFFGIVLSMLIPIGAGEILFKFNKASFRNRIILAVLLIVTELLAFSVIREQEGALALLQDFRNKKESYQTVAGLFMTSFILTLLILCCAILFRTIFSCDNTIKSVIIRKLPNREMGVIFLLFSASIMMYIVAELWTINAANGIKICEVCRKNTVEDISYYILENQGNYSYELNGMRLTTGETGTRLLNLDNKVILPNSKVKIEYDYDAGLGISKNGNTLLILQNATGEPVDTVLLPGISNDLAYVKNGDNWTLQEIEKENIPSKPSEPIFSRSGGFYNESFELTISSSENENIYFSLDGSIPTEKSVKYDKPIIVYNRSEEENVYRAIQNVREDYDEHSPLGAEPVDKAFVVRAIAVDSNGNKSDVITQTFFIALPQYEDKKVISLVADPEDLFGENGIYVTGTSYDEWYKRKLVLESEGKEINETKPLTNYAQRGSEWERCANLELFENSEKVLNQYVGIRIQGASARNLALKRFSVYARKTYSGKSVFDAPLFGNKLTHSFVLRQGFDNAFSNVISKERDIAYLRSVPVSVFINGEFWYETYMQEKYSDTYFSETYGVDKNNIETIQIGQWRRLSNQEKQVYEEFYELIAAMDYTDSECYSKINQIMDIQSFIDNTCINVYLGNADYYDKQNTLLWRTKLNEFSANGDGRWRFGLFDMDLRREEDRINSEYASDAEINSFISTGKAEIPAIASEGTLFSLLKQLPEFRKQFVLTFMDLINSNFEEKNVEEMLSQFGQDISYDHYFFRDRTSYIVPYLAEQFQLLGSLEKLHVINECDEKGDVVVNSINPEFISSDWEGSYFTDFPVKLEAIPSDKYTFLYWLVNGQKYQEPSIEVDLKKGGTEVHAFFE